MSTRLERVLDIGAAIAGLFGAADIVKLLSNPAKRQLGINRLTRERLVADPRQQSPKDLRTAGRLLPFYQTIPFDFRSAELEDYLNWCGQSDKKLAVRLITGASGRGKTRLMVELAGKLRDDGPILPGFSGPNWVSGFVDFPALQSAANGAVGDPYAVPFTANYDLCLIVDYAENRPDEVQRLLKAALAAIDEGRTELIRIILIARQHTEIFSTILQDSALAHRASAEIFDAPLKPVADPEAFFLHACEALNVPIAVRVYPERLRSETPDCGLLSLAALLAAAEQTPTTGSQEQILDKVLDHERRYWKEAARRHRCPEILIDQNVLELVAARLTLFGLQGAIPDIAAGVDLIADIPLLADQDYSVRSALVRSISELYPHPDGRIEGVGLDLLGDHLVVKTIPML